MCRCARTCDATFFCFRTFSLSVSFLEHFASQVYDLDAMSPTTPAVPPSPLSPSTVFLKQEWPTPTKIFDATAFGANGTDHKDDTAGIQAAIAAAATAGNGAMAYVPAGSYQINQTLQITGSDFWVATRG